MRKYIKNFIRTKKWKGKLDEIEQQMDFWGKADIYKINGFYVDFKNELVTPDQITNSEYDSALSATTFIKKEFKRLFDYLNSISDSDKRAMLETLNKDNQLNNIIELVTNPKQSAHRKNDTSN